MPNRINPRVVGMKCIRCQELHPLADYFEGCPACLKACIPASVAPHYDGFPSSLDFKSIGDWISYCKPSGLGEGGTSLSRLPRLAGSLGLGALYTKNEFTNPAGSHKDRMAAMIVQRALDVGVRTLAVASSGNAGASMAAYAAHGGLECVVVTTPDMSPNWRRAIEMYGARLVVTKSSDERWQLIAQKSKNGEWYPATNYIIPPVGSNPFGVDGYRAIALEIYLQLEELPTDIVVPTARGDLIWGIAKGFKDLQEAALLHSIPKVHAVEPFPRIEGALGGNGVVGFFPDETNMVSIGGNTVTQQSIHALEISHGSTATVPDGDVATDQAVLAKEGLYLELSSVASLTGLRKLINAGKIAPNAHVVLIATSHGYKEATLAVDRWSQDDRENIAVSFS
ncbi:pyridoxal-5'-phosphate-dependent protein subunit beta [Mesorhizobium sp. LSJC268A00]|uniref:threonine synthase n=1 Tax=unclassified Mesorhizobium TaxID=325217 RepID=UPI0003CE73D3|nr:pyridoxal-phosphate dependent enzyme [Mesorhizobium sp. LSJC268A00]ESX00622.1 pyridoxal-5'-phosphate-dependent protein subunit beta [Mesorhizobium sp. LSJC268A00]